MASAIGVVQHDDETVDGRAEPHVHDPQQGARPRSNTAMPARAHSSPNAARGSAAPLRSVNSTGGYLAAAPR